MHKLMLALLIMVIIFGLMNSSAILFAFAKEEEITKETILNKFLEVF